MAAALPKHRTWLKGQVAAALWEFFERVSLILIIPPWQLMLHNKYIMITLEDCIAFCGLTEEVVLVIAEHERVPEIVAASLASSLLSVENGAEKVRNMIVDSIRRAQFHGDRQHVLRLLRVLRHFLKENRHAIPSHRPWSAYL